MGVTSSGLLDEERDASADSMSIAEVNYPDNTIIQSGESGMGTEVSPGGPCKYTLP